MEKLIKNFVMNDLRAIQFIRHHLRFFASCLMIALMILSCACADLDLPSDGRLAYKDIFASYYLTKNYYTSCRSYIPTFGLEYDNNTPLASYCDEAHDTDDTQSGSGVNAWYNDRSSPFNNPLTMTTDWWVRMFQGVRKCNTFLQYINDPELATADISEEEKNGWIAEIHVLRAFFYLQIIKRYGGAPIMDTPYEVTQDYSTLIRHSFEECADFIIADCNIALAIPESSSPSTGFRWYILDNERGTLTRGLAWAIKSQTALYAASPLWYVPGSKYTWEYAATIAKEALDQCLANGYELYKVPVAGNAAQNPYAYYFIQRSDPSRSVDKETIYESGVRSNVWRFAGTPVTDGMQKAGAGPSQDLVDCYEMVNGEMPITGYSDANRLQPIINPASDYDPNDPYIGRDPRFYASVYYNNAPRSLTSSTPLVETFVSGNCGISDRVTDTRFTRTGYYLRKFNNHLSSPNVDADGFMKIFRLGELYMNFAEAAYQAYGPDAPVNSVVAGGSAMSARDAVNAIRARVDMPPLPPEMTVADFEKRYRNERRVEFAFEEQRFFDVRRWKILGETDHFVTGMLITKSEDEYIYTRFKLAERNTNSNKYLMFPLNQNEAAKMEEITGVKWQNPGW